MSKRERKRWRNARRRNVAKARRIISKILSTPRLTGLTERKLEKHNNCAKFINQIAGLGGAGGVPVIEGTADCPECGKEIWLMADPCQWTERKRPAWRRRRSNRKTFEVDDYWGGIGDCCKGFIASQPDGTCHFYPYDQDGAVVEEASEWDDEETVEA